MSLFVLGSMASYLVGPYSDFGRYMVPLLPVLAVVSVLLFKSASDGIRGLLPEHGRSAVYLIGLLLVVFGCHQALADQRELSAFFGRTARHQEARKSLGMWIEDNVPKGEVILSSDLGAIAYFAMNHDFIDVFGLTSAAPLTAIKQRNWGAFVDELKRRKPSWVADTGFPDGRLQSFEIVGFPQHWFRGLPFRESSYLNLYFSGNQVVQQRTTTDGYVFRLVKIAAAAYEQRELE